MTNPHHDPASHWTNRAWRLDDDREDHESEHRRWLSVLAALAAWPGPEIVVQRRLAVPGAGDLVSRELVVTIAGAGVVATRGELARDARQLVAPLLAGRRWTRLSGSDLDGAAGRGWRETAVIGPSLAHDDVAPAARDALAATLAALASGPGAAALCWSFGSRPRRRAGASGMVEARLSISVDDCLPAAALAHAAVLAGLPATGWQRPRTLSPMPDPAWAGSFSDPTSVYASLPTVLAADLAATPVASAALRRPGGARRVAGLGAARDGC